MNTNQKTFKLFSNRVGGMRAGPATKSCLASVLVGLMGYSWNTAIGQAQEAGNDVQGAEVLTRGPVHEAFAGIVSFNPEPGVVVTKAPPVALEEIPPGERPEGNNITWIPGYWAWDDERSDFLWVSGTWRALPPGRSWMAGYWAKCDQGYQWTCGYWADAAAEETTYLPAPPATVEDGPSTKAPSRDYGWTPGNWIWRQERYAWSPGYWAQGRQDWDWMPSHYVWTPRGYIFVDGYWDYSVQRRGMLFAPVYFDSGVYSRPGYNYSPSIVLDLALFAEHLFLRPNYHHYYFGDYYAPSYYQGGYYAAYSYQSNRRGYDPIYSHQRWEHRRDQGWDQRVETNYKYRRDNENARPPRTWAAMRTRDASTAEAKQNRMMLATPIDQLAKRKDGAVRLQPVAKQDRQMIAKRGQEVQQSREQRRTLETKSGDSAALKPGEVAAPAKVRIPRSPIVGKSAGQMKKNQAPPAALRSPKAIQMDPAKAEASGRPPKTGQNNRQAEPRQTEDGKKTTPGRNEATPRDKTDTPEPRKSEGTPRERQVQPEPRKKVEATPRERQVQPEPRKKVEATPRERQVQPEPRKKVEAAPREREVQPEPRKKVEAAPRERQVQPEPRKKVEAAPRERQDQSGQGSTGSGKNGQRTSPQPAKSKSAPSDEGEDKPGKKNRKKDSASD